MGFLDKLIGFFTKEEEVAVEDVNKTITEDIKVESNFNENQELLDILNSLNIDIDELNLNKLDSESEAVSNYAKSMIKDLAIYIDAKDKKNETKDVMKNMGKKMNLIKVHGLELKNLLGILENNYYEPLLDVLKKLNLKLNKDEISILIEDLEKDFKLVKDFDTKITKVIAYDELLNPGKESYTEDLEKEARKRIIHGDLNELIDHILLSIADSTKSIKNKIERAHVLRKVRELIQ